MKKSLFALCLFLSLPVFASDTWTEEDTKREAVYQTFHVLDWAQTRNIARNPDKWYETNQVLGRHPSTDRVDAYFISMSLLHYLVASELPSKYREAFQYVSIGVEAGYVQHNLSLGIAIKF